MRKNIPTAITTTNCTENTPIMYAYAYDNRDWSKPIEMIEHPG